MKSNCFILSICCFINAFGVEKPGADIAISTSSLNRESFIKEVETLNWGAAKEEDSIKKLAEIWGDLSQDVRDKIVLKNLPSEETGMLWWEKTKLLTKEKLKKIQGSLYVGMGGIIGTMDQKVAYEKSKQWDTLFGKFLLKNHNNLVDRLTRGKKTIHSKSRGDISGGYSDRKTKSGWIENMKLRGLTEKEATSAWKQAEEIYKSRQQKKKRTQDLEVSSKNKNTVREQ